MTVRQLLASLDSKELSEWIAFYNLDKREPKEPERMSLDDQFKKALNPRRRNSK